MNYRRTDAPNSNVVHIKINLGQLKILHELVTSELSDAEIGSSPYEEKPLQRLVDLFHPHLFIKLSDEEKQKQFDAWRKEYTAAEYEITHGVKL